MRVFQQANYTTLCGTPSHWNEMKDRFAGAEKVSVIDLRCALESREQPLDKMPDTWLHRQLSVRGTTVSEQDIDVIRREQRRFGRLILVAGNMARGVLLALTDLARLERTPLPESETKQLEGLEQELELFSWLNQYLDRHQTTTVGQLE